MIRLVVTAGRRIRNRRNLETRRQRLSNPKPNRNFDGALVPGQNRTSY
jgi:hypothetical protein